MKRFLGYVFCLAVFALPAVAQNQKPIRINCGGSGYTDPNGTVWQADNGFTGGTASNIVANVAGTQNPQLYQTGRVGTANSPLSYRFAVPNGVYHLNLFFAETAGFNDPGERVFNVSVEGNVAITNLDIAKEAGAKHSLVKSVDFTVTDGTAAIDFLPLVQNPKVNGIEIYQKLATPELRLNFVYPDGKPVAGNLNYTITTTATTMSGQQPLANGQATCLLISSPALLGLVGQMQTKLSLTDNSGNTIWQMGLTLNPASADFSSVQSSVLSVVVGRP